MIVPLRNFFGLHLLRQRQFIDLVVDGRFDVKVLGVRSLHSAWVLSSKFVSPVLLNVKKTLGIIRFHTAAAKDTTKCEKGGGSPKLHVHQTHIFQRFIAVLLLFCLRSGNVFHLLFVCCRNFSFHLSFSFATQTQVSLFFNVAAFRCSGFLWLEEFVDLIFPSMSSFWC